MSYGIIFWGFTSQQHLKRVPPKESPVWGNRIMVLQSYSRLDVLKFTIINNLFFFNILFFNHEISSPAEYWNIIISNSSNFKIFNLKVCRYSVFIRHQLHTIKLAVDIKLCQKIQVFKRKLRRFVAGRALCNVCELRSRSAWILKALDIAGKIQYCSHYIFFNNLQ